MQNRYTIINGNSLEVLDTLEENSVDSIVTDPPYELGFMGKKWDNTGIAYNVELWKKALCVLKPGGYLLAFGGTRTYHRICCAIEDAGFEIRDCVMWLYGSGFPKSMNIGLAIDKKNGVESEVVGTGKSGSTAKAFNLNEQQREAGTGVLAGEYEIKKAKNEWDGWGTALKPAYEPIIVARKPVEETVINNVLKYGVGGINIDECRIGDEVISTHNAPKGTFAGGEPGRGSDTNSYSEHAGRFPSNLILTYDETDKDEVCGGMPESDTPNGSISKPYEMNNRVYGDYGSCNVWEAYQDSGSAARYFYCAKASSKDRDEGLDDFEVKTKVFNGKSDKSSTDIKDVEERFTTELRNIHPTVKPTELMQYLVRLVTPKGGTVLDIFNGSGSTGKAVAFENREREADYKYIGIELDPEYCKISEARIDYAANKYHYDVIAEIKENEKKGQLSLFDFIEEDDSENSD